MEIAEEILFVLCFDVWPGASFTSNKSAHYILDHGDFLNEISINLNMLLSLLLFVYFVYIYPCSVAAVCLLVYPLFTLVVVVATFFFIRRQVPCFVFVAIVYRFNNTISIFVRMY